MNFRKLEDLMVIIIKITVFFWCDIVQFGKCYQILVNIHQTTWHYVSEKSNIQLWETPK